MLDTGIEDAVARLAVSRGSGKRGYRPSGGEPTLVLSLNDASAWGSETPPLTVAVCETRIAHQPQLAGIKHANRLEQVLAAAELGSLEVDEGLQLDMSGRLVCATAANLFVGIDGILLTPPLEQCGVAGTVRQLIIDELAPAADIPLQVSPIEPADLARADELFLTNAVSGIRPVLRCGRHSFTSTRWGDTLRSHFHRWSDTHAW